MERIKWKGNSNEKKEEGKVRGINEVKQQGSLVLLNHMACLFQSKRQQVRTMLDLLEETNININACVSNLNFAQIIYDSQLINIYKTLLLSFRTESCFLQPCGFHWCLP